MNATMFQPIEKEAISELHFPHDEVLTDKDAIRERDTDLQNALTLGNLEHSKIRIFFEDDATTHVVETTVWGLTDKRVILKQGVVIPINRIHRIKI